MIKHAPKSIRLTSLIRLIRLIGLTASCQPSGAVRYSQRHSRGAGV